MQLFNSNLLVAGLRKNLLMGVRFALLLASSSVFASSSDSLPLEDAPENPIRIDRVNQFGISSSDQLAASLRALDVELSGMLNTHSSVSGSSARNLVSQLDAVIGGNTLVLAGFEKVRRKLELAKASPIYFERLNNAKQNYQTEMAGLIDLVNGVNTQIRSERKHSVPESLLAIKAITQRLRDQNKQPAGTILRTSDLPVASLNFPVQRPQTSPSVIPSYQDESVVIAQGSDIPTSDISEAVAAKALELEYEPVALYEFVLNSIETELYHGSVRSAESTLLRERGNSTDQAVLLSQLFRVSGIQANLVQGIVSIPIENLTNLIGTNNSQSALSALRKSGIPYQEQVIGGKVRGVDIEQTWLSAKVPYSNYRGATVDRSGLTWLPLFPSLKAYSVPDRDVSLIDVEGIFNRVLSEPNSSGVLSELGLSQVDINQVNQRHITEVKTGFLPSSTPYPIKLVTHESVTPKDSLVQRATIKVFSDEDTSGVPVLNISKSITELLGKSISLGYQPESQEDHNLVLSLGGLSNTPLYLVNLRPVLHLGGRILAVGEAGIAAGKAHTLEVTYESEVANFSTTKSVFAGGFHSIGVSMPGTSLNVRSDEHGGAAAARILASVADRYADSWFTDRQDIAALAGHVLLTPMPVLTFVSNDQEFEFLLGQPISLNWKGVNIDAAFWPVESVAANDSAWAPDEFKKITGLHGSWLEHRVLEQQFNVASVSADKGIALAHLSGQAVLSLLQQDLVTLEQDLEAHSENVVEDVKNWLQLGYTVKIPRELTTLDDWTGSVWIVTDTSSGSSGYFISGGLAGGSTASTPIGESADLLRNPNESSESNNNPESAAVVQLFPATNFQISAADEKFESLKVRVLDVNGSPIRGANVTFTLLTGGGGFEAGGDESSSTLVQAVTGTGGIASAVYRAGKNISEFEIQDYVLPEGKSTPFEAGTSYISIAVDRGSKPRLTADDFFKLFTVANNPTELRRLAGRGPGLVGSVRESLFREILVLTDEFGNPVADEQIEFTAKAPEFASSGGAVSVEPHLVYSDDCPAFANLDSGCGFTNEVATTNAFGEVGVGIIFGQVTEDSSLIPATYPIEAKYSDEVSLRLDYLASSPSLIKFVTPSLKPAVRAGELIEFETLARIDRDQLNRFKGGRLQTLDSKLVKVFSGTLDASAEFTGDEVITYFNQPTSEQPGTQRALVAWDYSYLSPTSNGLVERTDVEEAISPFQTTGVLITPTTQVNLRVDNGLKMDSFAAIDYEIAPQTYVPRYVYLNVYEDDQLIYTQKANESYAVIPPIQLTAGANYSAELVANQGRKFDEVKSDRFPISVSAPIIRSLSDGNNNQISSTGGGRGSIITDDINNATCVVNEPKLVFELNEAARVTLHSIKTNIRGQSIIDTEVIRDEQFSAGRHIIDRNTLLFQRAFYKEGKTPFEIVVTSTQTGKRERQIGSFYMNLTQLSPLPVGSPMYEDINLFRGGLFLSKPDISVPGRGPDIEIVRSYSSSNIHTSSFGPGWGHNYESTVEEGPCGWVTVNGGVAGGVTFFPDGEGGYRAGRGYHSSLEFYDGGWSFFAKDGTEYRYQSTFDTRRYYLDSIRDTNGNTTQLIYNSAVLEEPRIDFIRDSSGRQIQFHYQNIGSLASEQIGTEIVPGPDGDTSQPVLGWRVYYPRFASVITQITGLGYQLDYQYDNYGRLVSVANVDASRQSGDRIVERYDYGEVLAEGEEDQNKQYSEYRGVGIRKLTDFRGVSTDYDYEIVNRSIQLVLEAGVNAPFTKRSQLVIAKTKRPNTNEPGIAIKSSFEYQGIGVAPVATVTDPRNVDYEYAMDTFGRSLSIDGPTGLREMTWPPNDTLMLSSIDENGVVTQYQYDEFGNQTREQISGPLGGSFESEREFTTAQNGRIRNLIKRAIDRRGNTTNFSYDKNGNLLKVQYPSTRDCPSPCEETFTYQSNGDRQSAIDERRNRTVYRYDQFGNVAQTRYPIGTSKVAYDLRSRPVSQEDENGNTSQFSYDWLNRLVRQVNAEGGVKEFSYDENSNKLTERDEEGRTKFYQYDFDNRIIRTGNIGAANEIIEMSQRYDANDNLVLETDYRGNATEHEYDDANRRVRSVLPASATDLIRFIDLAYDNSTNIKTQTIHGTDGEPQLTQFEYDNLYRQTNITDAEGGLTRQIFDANDNLIGLVDELGRVSELDYDERNLKIAHREAVGSSVEREVQWFYDPANNEISHIDARGNFDRKEYDKRDRLIQFVNNEGNRYFYNYDDYGNRISEFNHFSFKTEFEYDELHRRTAVIDQRGFKTSTSYDLVGNTTQQRYPNGNVIDRAFDFLNRVVTESDSIGPLNVYEYDADNNVLLQRDAKGFETTHTYDALGQLIESREPEQRTSKRSYDVFGNLVESIDGEGNSTRMEYDRLNRENRLTDANSFSVSTVYDAVDNKITEADKRGNTTSWVYDELNRVVRQRDPAAGNHSRDISFVYDANDNLVSTTDKRGIKSDTVFDALNRPVQERRAGVLILQSEYSEIGNRIGTIDANGNTSAFKFNQRHEQVEASLPEQAITLFEYDAMGDITRQRDPEGRVMSYTFDERRRKTTETNNASETTSYEYDLNNNQTQKTRPRGNSWRYNYDQLNRLVQITDAQDGITQYEYDRANNLVLYRDANGNEKRYEYDALNRKALLRYPLVSGQAPAVCEYDYDPNSNLTVKTDANGQIHTHTFDALNRRIQTRYQNPLATVGRDISLVETTYDGNNNETVVSETYSLSTGGNEVRTSQSSFDDFDRLFSRTDSWGKALIYDYDLNGNRVSLTDSDNLVTVYAYDGLNRIRSVRNQAGSTGYEYDRSSLLDSINYANGTSTRYTYDPAMRVERIHHQHNNATVSLFEYEFDNNGNRTVQRETNGGDEEVSTYGYDPNDRLTNVVYPDKAVSYTYDANYNRLNEQHTSTDNTQLVNKTYSYNARNQLTNVDDTQSADGAATYRFDLNGNQIEKSKAGDTTQFVFDIRDDLREVLTSGGTVGQFLYDQQGLRIEKLGERGAERSTFDGQSLLQQYDENDQTQAKFDYGPDRLLSLDSNEQGTQFYLQDALGSVSNLISPQGQIQARYQYDAWGIKRTEQANTYNRFAFTGYEEDKETGLLYAKARFYDPDTGKFLSEDAWDGDNMIAPSLHKYLYAYQNPTVWVDPTGNYNEAGHFYTTYYVARSVGYGHVEAHELALFSQVPDEVPGFDAIENSKRFVFSIPLLKYRPDQFGDVRSNMLLTHSYGHGLTGGTAGDSRDLASFQVLNKNNGIAGLAIHLLGDSYSHVIFGEEGLGREAKLYSPLDGHLKHLKTPDQIHRRKNLYNDYVDHLGSILAQRLHSGDDVKISESLVALETEKSKYLALVDEAVSAHPNMTYHYGRDERKQSITQHSKIDSLLNQKFRNKIINTYPDADDGVSMIEPLNKSIVHWDILDGRSDAAHLRELIETAKDKRSAGLDGGHEQVLDILDHQRLFLDSIESKILGETSQ